MLATFGAGCAVLSLRDHRVGTDKLLAAAKRLGLQVVVQAAATDILKLAREESGAEDLCEDGGYSLYFIKWAQQ